MYWRRHGIGNCDRESLNMSDFQYTQESSGVAIITWNVPHQSMNTMSWQSMQQMADLFDQALTNSEIKGIILTSSKPDFAGGMNLESLAKVKSEFGGDHAKRIFDTVMNTHQLFRRIELAGGDIKSSIPGKPIAAALPGTAVGIGYEIPLCCHRIFMADNPAAKIGLPEIKVGLFPGAGGTIRLVRRLGLAAAGPLLLKGSMLSPQKALQAKLIDEVVAPENLLDRARQWVLNANPEDIIKSWDKKSYRMPGGRPYDPEGYMSFVAANAMLNGSTSGVYLAANAMMSAIYEGALTTFDKALEVEARWFTHVILDPNPTNMINTLFLNKKKLEKGAKRPANIKKTALHKVGVVGAGMMGSGIALVTAQSGIEVVLLDQTVEAAELGKSQAQSILEKKVELRRLDQDTATQTLQRIHTSNDFEALKGADLIIEAVFEDPAIKAEVIANIDTASDCIIASNTSTLPISGLSSSCRSPDKFLGIHFFSPVDRMLLVEIIRGKNTADEAVALSLDYVRRIRKTPIVVNDARFFYANRCVIPYLNEGIRMVGEGISPALIENAARQCGMPVGPLQLVDETSIDLAARIAKATKKAMGDQYLHTDADKVIFDLFELGRLGRKANAGFYDYHAGKRGDFWPKLKERYPPLTVQPSVKFVQQRLLLIQTIEAVMALQEGILTDVREGDVGAVLGWGFAPWSGGPFSWVNTLGVEFVLNLCDELQNRCGERFRAPELLRTKASAGEIFATHKNLVG